MPLRDWLRAPRQLLTAFLAVALVSAGALGWLGWLLLRQDAALESQRRQERIEQAADRAAAAMQRAVAALEAHAASQPDASGPLPAGVAIVTIRQTGVAVRPAGSLLYCPVVSLAAQAPPATFADAEQAEFAGADPAAAARLYLRSTAAADPAVRAGAFARLARVRRKLRDVDGAIQAYGQLARIEQAHVEGIPATLVARTGRASVFDETHRTPELHAEARALQRELLSGRWSLTASQFKFYLTQANDWLGTPAVPNADALARADAVDWLWQNRDRIEGTSRRALALTGGPAFVAWQPAADALHAVVAGPAYLATLCAEGIPAGLRCALTDQEGRTFVGQPPPARLAAVRPAPGLPWMLHVSDPETRAVASPRRRLLTLSFAVVAAVLIAGWYFILRAMSREMRVSRLQSDFVAAVSHEFRSPLTSLSHVADMLASGRFPTPDLQRKSYEVLVRDTDRLRDLVEGLLDFGRFEAGAATLRLEPIDLAALVRTTVADFQQRVAPDGYAVALTGTEREIYAQADREALSRALWNLLDNAAKYSPECRTVWVDVEQQGDRVAIVVRDEGLGIPMDEQHEVFDRFVRGAESKARRIKGTGIGLAMVRQIVQAHGGDIHLTSEPGRGSRFTMVLRAAEGVA